MTLHEALPTIWRHAGQTILWWSVLALFVSGVIAAAGWRRLCSPERQAPPRQPDQFPPEQAAIECGALGVAAEASAVLRQFQNLAAQQLVRLEMAVQPGLVIRTDQRPFREILGDLVRRAIEQSPCGCVLLTAARIGSQVHVSVSDDGPAADGAIRLTRLGDAERLVALQGGSMDIDSRPGEGTTVTIRLPGSDASGSDANGDGPDPASARPAARNKSEANNIAH